MIAPIENAFRRSEITRAITKEESLRILKDAADAGLIHSTANHQEGIYYICNCCICCCGILRGISEFDVPAAVVASDFHTIVDKSLCTGCGTCVEQCHFGALGIQGDICIVNESRCVGCGLCVPSCSFEAISLKRRTEGKTVPPENLKLWMKKRAQQRGIKTST
jgi:ferredoxin